MREWGKRGERAEGMNGMVAVIIEKESRRIKMGDNFCTAPENGNFL